MCVSPRVVASSYRIIPNATDERYRRTLPTSWHTRTQPRGPTASSRSRTTLSRRPQTSMRLQRYHLKMASLCFLLESRDEQDAELRLLSRSPSIPSLSVDLSGPRDLSRFRVSSLMRHPNSIFRFFERRVSLPSVIMAANPSQFSPTRPPSRAAQQRRPASIRAFKG